MKKNIQAVAFMAMALPGITGCERSLSGKQAPSPLMVLLKEEIQPRYGHLVSQAEQLNTVAARFCATPDNFPDQKAFGKLQEQWRNTMLSWQSAEAVSQLLLEEDMESWRFQFWPDKKNLVGRKVHQRINHPAPPPILSDSVILQGLSASEYLLFDPQAGNIMKLNTPRYCQLLQENADALLSNSSELQQRWQEEGSFQQQLISMEQKSPDKSETPLGFNGWLLNSLDSQLSRLKRKLALPIGRTPPNLFMAESWRSQQSLENIQASLIAVESVVSQAESLAPEASHQTLWRNLSTGLNGTLNSLQQLPPGFKETLNQKKAGELQRLQQNLDRLSSQVVTTARQMNVTLGFNASDGD